MKPYSEMTKEELAAYTKEAISYWSFRARI